MKSAFIKSIHGGAAIGLAGLAFISTDNPVLGSLVFTIGLFIILTQKFYLFTGCITDFNSGPNIGLVYVGNMIGTGLVALIIHFTRIADVAYASRDIMLTKINNPLYIVSAMFLGVFCQFMINFAVKGYKSNEYRLLKLTIGVSIFVLCGFEHCIANMFYIWMALPKLSLVQILDAAIVLSAATTGNLLGASIIHLGKEYTNEL